MRTGSGAIVIIGTIASLYFARDVLIPFAFALTLTFLLSPVVDLLQRLRAGRAVAVVTTVVVSFAIAGGIGWVIASQFIDVANQLPLYRENIQAKITALHRPVSGAVGRAAASVQEIAKALSTPGSDSPAGAPTGQKPPPAPKAPLAVQVVDPPSSEWAEFRALVTPIVGPLGRTGIVVLFSVFMLLQREDLRNRVLRLAGIGQLNLMTQALDDAAKRVSRYLLMQFLVNAGFGTVFGLGLYAIGVPYPLLWGVVAGILRIVPYIGTLAAAALPIALSLAIFDGWEKPLFVFLLVAILELLVGNFLEPWLYGIHVGISSLALLVTAVFWAVLWGPAGLILSTPLTVCAVVLGRYVPQLAFLHILLGDEPALSPEAQVYQRLLAMDQLEAQTIVDQCLKEKSLVELYDTVLIPALSLAEQDRHKGTIDGPREEFLFLSVNEMIAEFSERQLSADPPVEAPPVETPPVEAPPVRSAGRVFCLAAHDHADEITSSMLAQLLEKLGFAAVAFPAGGSPPNEWLALLQAGPDDVACISALPPYAFAPAKALCKQIRDRFPHLRIVACVWGFGGDATKAIARFDRAQPEYLCTSLAETLARVEEVLRPADASGPSLVA